MVSKFPAVKSSGVKLSDVKGPCVNLFHYFYTKKGKVCERKKLKCKIMQVENNEIENGKL